MRLLRHAAGAVALALATAALGPAPAKAEAWDIAKAAAPYKGTELHVIFLDRPGYRAIIKLLPEFEKQTGIKVSYEIVPYENTREKEVLNFNGQGDLSIALVDLVWIGEFAENGWIQPVSKFSGDASITDPNLNLKGFFPLLLDAFGTWGGTTYGLPFDNYSGLLFYNKCMLKSAGFDKPPATWDEVMTTYAPKLTDPAKKQYGYALQSLRGETQSADSFMRMLWPFGGSLLDKTFHSNLMSKESQAGLDFRQKLMKYMPPGIVSWDHAESVNALAQGQVAMITEWSAFYPTLTDPKTSKLGDCLGVAPEPAGPAGTPAGAGRLLARRRQPGPREGAEGRLDLHPVGHVGRHRQALRRGRRRVGPDRRLRRSRHPRALFLRRAHGGLLAEGRAGIPPALPVLARHLGDRRGIRLQDHAGRGFGRAGLEGDRHPHGSRAAEGRLLRRQEEAAAVAAASGPPGGGR